MTITVTIGIPAYNEEKNIGNLLDAILSQELPQDIKMADIIIVASGCTDNTAGIVREYQQKNPIIKLIVEEERGGQASAHNLILDAALGDVLVIGCADTRPTSQAIANLVKPMQNDTTIGAVVGKAEPVNDPETLWGYIAHLAYRLLYLPQILMVDQEGMSAVRKELVDKLPLSAIAVEHYIDAGVKKKGYKVIHAPDAITFTKQPDNLHDFTHQRRRNTVLHLQQEHSGIKAPHISLSTLIPLVFRSMEPNPRKLYYLTVMVTLWGFTYIAGWFDFRKGNSYKNWEMISSTKSLNTEEVN